MKNLKLINLKILLALVMILCIFSITACDTELGHHHEDHDHDGEGIQDHTAEEHDNEVHEFEQTHADETS